MSIILMKFMKENKSIEKKSYFEKFSIVLLMGVVNIEWKIYID